MFGIMAVELLGSDSVFGFTDTALITEKRLFSCLDMCVCYTQQPIITSPLIIRHHQQVSTTI